ncbi:MAG: MFS transporter [Dehalococcoidales bacterium]|nr:MFS transporter [Dehalococcoidales bacterium]
MNSEIRARDNTRNKWLNKNILGMAWAAFFSDFSHEMATSVLPVFLASIGGSAALLGLIEGLADASTSLMKILSGWYSDYLGRRKPLAMLGYFLTTLGVGMFALAFSWPHVLVSRVVSWTGRGTRGPPRDALLVDSTKQEYYSRVIGFNRGMDTLGAVIGPVLALVLIRVMPIRSLFVIAMIPGILAFLVFAIVVKEMRGRTKHVSFVLSIKGLPGNFRFFIVAVGIFGLGNFADSMLILRATELLSPAWGAVVAASFAILLYTIHNVFYAALSFPIGVIADKIGKKRLLVLGYFLTGVTSAGFMLNTGNFWYLVLFFVLAGLAIAITDSMEKTVAADLLPDNLRGTGYGALATINGLGDFASSALVGLLWTAISPAAGFGYAAVFCVLGAILLQVLLGRGAAAPTGGTQ